MIHVDRSKADPGSKWKSLAEQATTEPEFDRKVLGHPALLTALNALFAGRCAYCESRVDPPVNAEQFRPRAAAIALDGATAPGYWWLAYEWTNLYLVCPRCSRNKGNRFPVLGKRMRVPARERPVLLDPCADDPEQHLLFSSDGRVASRSAPAPVDRGQVTIDILGLNRPDLVDARREAAQALQARFRRAVRNVAELVDDTQPYVALQRQLAHDLIHEPPAGGADEYLQLYQRAHEEDLRRDSIEQDPNLESRQSQRIARVEIENFRGITKLGFDLGIGDSEAAGWTMLLGENGVGKSSVLQALAVALMGEKRLEELGADGRPAELLRRGEKRGVIRVIFSADAEPLEVHLTPDKIEFGATAARPRMIVLGFGSARWLPRPGGFEPDPGEYVRINNLFNPFVPLADTLRWLGSLSDPEFTRAEGALLRLLRLDAGEHLVRADGEILVRARRQRITRAIPLRQFSDGYQSVVAMVGDIMELLQPKRLDMSVAEGLVLVDELEAHLHPRWKMQVVTRLRQAFPALQFVSSTHDPLCLRGLRDGEVLLLQRDARGEIVGTSELPSVRAMRIDQLLTSPFFGLHTTRDMQIEEAFDEYYGLLARPRLTDAERERLEELTRELDTRGQLGGDRREKMMLQAIDRHLAREAEALADGTREALSEQTAQTLESILDRVSEAP